MTVSPRRKSSCGLEANVIDAITQSNQFYSQLDVIGFDRLTLFSHPDTKLRWHTGLEYRQLEDKITIL